MPIHSCLVVCSRDSRILFSKYYDRSILENPVLHTQFDRAVLDETCHYWGGSFRTFSILFDNISVVFGKIGNLILYLSGTDECDEIVLTKLFDTFEKVIEDIYGTKSKTDIDSIFMKTEEYGKFSVAVDEAISDGIIETMNAEEIGRLSKLKNV